MIGRWGNCPVLPFSGLVFVLKFIDKGGTYDRKMGRLPCVTLQWTCIHPQIYLKGRHL